MLPECLERKSEDKMDLSMLYGCIFKNTRCGDVNFSYFYDNDPIGPEKSF